MSKNYNEKTRVQMPAMIHLTRLGFNYIGKMYEENAGETFDSETNILIDKFRAAFEPEQSRNTEVHTSFNIPFKKSRLAFCFFRHQERVE